MRRGLLDFSHGVDEDREEVLLEHDYPNPAALNLVVEVVLVVDALLAAKGLLEDGSVLLALGLDGDPEAIVGDDSGVVALGVVGTIAVVIAVFEHFLDGLLGHAGHQQQPTAVFVLDIDVLLLSLAPLDLDIAQKGHLLDDPEYLLLGEVPEWLKLGEDVEFDIEIAGHVGDELELAEDVVDAQPLLDGCYQGLLC